MATPRQEGKNPREEVTSSGQEVTSEDDLIDETFYDYETNQFVASHAYAAQGEQQVQLITLIRGAAWRKSCVASSFDKIRNGPDCVEDIDENYTHPTQFLWTFKHPIHTQE